MVAFDTISDGGELGTVAICIVGFGYFYDNEATCGNKGFIDGSIEEEKYMEVLTSLRAWLAWTVLFSRCHRLGNLNKHRP